MCTTSWQTITTNLRKYSFLLQTINKEIIRKSYDSNNCAIQWQFFFFNKITVNESLKILEISVCDFIDQMIMKIKDN